jgi:hypothetical protein
VPAEARALAERAADERREEGAEVDPHVEDREARVAAYVAGTVELPDHRAHVRLEEAGADDDEPRGRL